jgi:hypothetical protein
MGMRGRDERLPTWKDGKRALPKVTYLLSPPHVGQEQGVVFHTITPTRPPRLSGADPHGKSGGARPSPMAARDERKQSGNDHVHGPDTTARNVRAMKKLRHLAEEQKEELA